MDEPNEAAGMVNTHGMVCHSTMHCNLVRYIHILRTGFIYCEQDSYTANGIHILRTGFIYCERDSYTASGIYSMGVYSV
jgi:hypothetical protein